MKRENVRRHDTGAPLQFFSQQGTSPVQSRLNGLNADPEHLRRVIHVQTFDSPEDENGAIFLG
jgi:hypothetical protein